MDLFAGYLGTVVKVLKSPKLQLGVFILSIIALSLPKAQLIQLGILNIVNHYRAVFGISALIAFVLIFLELIEGLWICYKSSQRHKKILKRLNSLSKGERDILMTCLNNRSQSFSGSVNSTSARALCQKEIVVMAQMGNMMGMSYTIKDFVWDFLNKKPEIIADKKY